MRFIDDYSDQRWKGGCAQCGVAIHQDNKSSDHVPSKCLLRKSEGRDKNQYPDNLPVIFTCIKCNQRFSKDEEYFRLFLNCVLVGSTSPEDHSDPDIQRSLQRHARLRARIEASKRFVILDGEERLTWTPEFERIHRVVVKNARGHAFYELGQPVLEEPEDVWVTPLEGVSETERSDFEVGPGGVVGWPEVGSRAMTRVVTGIDMHRGWVVVQPSVYRYRVEHDGLLVRTIIREYLATEVRWADL